MMKGWIGWLAINAVVALAAALWVNTRFNTESFLITYATTCAALALLYLIGYFVTRDRQ